jgi:hypothetical protein
MVPGGRMDGRVRPCFIFGLALSFGTRAGESGGLWAVLKSTLCGTQDKRSATLQGCETSSI